MKTAADIESYLIRLGTPFDQIGGEMWNVTAEHENVVISLAGPLLVFRTKVMDVPSKNREALFEQLLSLNTTDLVHGAFGIEGKSVVLNHALELENLDYNEFSAVVDDFSMSLNKHYAALTKFREPA